LFVSYAHEDAEILAQLRKHLAPLRHEQIVDFWSDHELLAGQAWNDEILAQLERADIVVVLISSDFVDSNYAYGKELGRALELHRLGRLQLIVVLARSCLWESLPFARYQVVPPEGRAITSWANRDDAYVAVATAIAEVAQRLLSAGDSLVDDWLTSRLIRQRVIREVQQHLAYLGMYDGPIDGIPGRGTELAVRRFQESEGIPVDARIGPDVIQRLEAAAARPT